MSEASDAPREEFLPVSFPDLVFGAGKHLITLPEQRNEFKRIIIEPLAREGAAYFLLSGRLLVAEGEKIGYRFREFAAMLVGIAGRQAVRDLEDRVAREAYRELKKRGALTEPTAQNLAVRYIARQLLQWEELADAVFKATPPTEDSEYLTSTRRDPKRDAKMRQHFADILRDPPSYFLDALLSSTLGQLEDDLLESWVAAKYGIHLRSCVEKGWGDTTTSRQITHIVRGEVTAAADELIARAKITQQQLLTAMAASLPVHIAMIIFAAWEEAMQELGRK